MEVPNAGYATSFSTNWSGYVVANYQTGVKIHLGQHELGCPGG